MARLSFWFLLSLLLVLPLCLAGQTNTEPLPDNDERLVEELEKILTFQNQKASVETWETFKKNIKARKITEQHYQAIRELGNLLASKKMKRYNFFTPFIKAINAFSDDHSLSNQYLDKWIEISGKILNQEELRTSAFEAYLEFSYVFWAYGYLYQKGSSHIWLTDSKNFTMRYEGDQLALDYTGVQLVCFQQKGKSEQKGAFTDSLIINNATGTYYPLREVWEGRIGRVEWAMQGATDAYADIRDYEINFRFTEYEADNAVMSYPSVFKKPAQGKLRDRAVRRDRKDLDYPRFESQDKNIVMEDVGEGVNYTGGFSMRGAKVRGAGTEAQRSTIVVRNRQGQEVLRAISAEFDINRGEQVLSNKAEVSIYMLGDDGVLDSIYHPGIRFSYNIKKREVTLERAGNQGSRVPFFNSASRLEMNAPIIVWQIDSDELDIGDNNQTVNFDSDNFFDEALFEKYTLTSTYNALVKIALYSEARKKAIYEIADGYKSPSANVQDAQRQANEEKYWRQFCEEYPQDCPYPEYLPKDPEADNKPEQEPKDRVLPFDPNSINTNDVARIFDKRMEYLIPCGMEKVDSVRALKRADLKIVRSVQDLRDFQKGFPYTYTKGYVYVFDIPRLTANPPPSFNSNNAMKLFLDLAADGFVFYNQQDTTIELRAKLFHYFNSANKTSKHDYDLVRIKSVRSPTKNEPNAKFNLKEKNMETVGVRSFVLSDSQRVHADPFEGRVTIKKGRDIDFDGNLYAGFVNFFGQGFHFRYEDFAVDMDSIQGIYVNIYKRARFNQDDGPLLAGRGKPERLVEEYDPMTGEPSIYSRQTEPINSVISQTTGMLQIDVGNNKSGRQGNQKNQHLPSFDCTAPSRVYYDSDYNRQGPGVYPRETFYYELKPFILEPLDDEAIEKHLVFAGKFHSADILPVVSDSLRVMYHDLSFGFESETPKEGFPVYLRDEPDQGKGRYRGIFGLSNEGLIGRGRLDYLGAKIESEYIEFRPESFSATDVDSFYLAPVQASQGPVEYPEVRGEKVKIDWAPYGDSMLVQYDPESGVPFRFYEAGKHQLQESGGGAALILKPDGLYGYGEFFWDEAVMRTTPNSYFLFGHHTVYSASAAVEIKAGEEFGDNGAWYNENVEATVDFEKQVGDFLANQEGFSDLPHNSYKTNLDRFHWDMAKGIIDIESTQGKTGFFLATEQAKDSLFFEGLRANFNIHTGLLQIDGVEYIRVADAFIYPKDEHVEIEEKAYMRTLLDSRILADTSNQNHQIQRASINILSRKEYTADGFLEFNIEDKDQEIRFDNVRVSEEGEGRYVTKGQGNIEESANFFLDKKTRFKGDVRLAADSKDLTFKGFARINSSVIPTQEWFDVDSRIDKKRVAISFDAPQNPAGQILHVGLFLSTDSATIYPAILSPKRDDTDRAIFKVKGVLRYEPKEETFHFGDSAKVLGDAIIGKKMSVAEKNGKVSAEGRFSFSEGFAPTGVNLDILGDFSFFLGAAKSDYRFEVSACLDLPMPSGLIDFLVDDLNKNPEGVDKILYNAISRASRIRRNLTELVKDQKKLDRLLKRMDDENRLQLTTDLLPHSFFFSHLTLIWSDKTQSFVSTPNLELATINGRHIGQVLKGYVEVILDPDRGDILNFSLTSPNNQDVFFFSYQGGILRTFSTSPDYPALFAQIKKKDRKIKSTTGKNIEIELASQQEYDNFRNRAKSAH